MGDKWTEVLENYDVEARGSSKGRYAQLVEADCGLLQLRPQLFSDGRLKSEFDFKERLFAAGFENIDRLIYNRDGELAAADRYGTMHVLREYFYGREISLTNMAELDMAVENLARLHLAGRRIWLFVSGECEERIPGREDNKSIEYVPTVRDSYDLTRRNRELKRVRAYIGRQVNKSKFEEMYLRVYENFFIQAQHAEGRLNEMRRDSLNVHTGYCHGDYNNHNILMISKERKLATVGFDKFYVGNQLSDLYYFARKSVEKNGYNFEVLRRIIEGYGRYIELDRNDLEYVYVLFCYPEKFYKLSSRYLNGSKVRISPVMLDKLDKIIGSEAKKQKLLSNYRDIFLHI